MFKLTAQVKALPLLMACWLAGCALAAGDLRPTRVTPEQGAYFGNVRITNLGVDITRGCRIGFYDAQGKRQAYVRLDKTGWVFGTVRPGRTDLTQLLCIEDGILFRKTHTPPVKGVHFEVPGQRQIAYFGHLHIELNDGNRSGAAAQLIGGTAGTMMHLAYLERAQMTVDVQNKLDAAEGEYSRRYGSPGAALKVFDAVSSPVGTAKALVLRQDEVVEQVVFDGVQLFMLGLPRSDPSKVELRLQHFVSKAEFPDCTVLLLSLDGKTTRLALSYEASAGTTPLQETLRADTDIDQIEALASAHDVKLSLCGKQHGLFVRATEAARSFVTRFKRHRHP